MIRVIFASLFLAFALVLANQPAKAEWLCGVDRCVWVSYDVNEPAYALAWGLAGLPELLLAARRIRPLENDLPGTLIREAAQASLEPQGHRQGCEEQVFCRTADHAASIAINPNSSLKARRVSWLLAGGPNVC